MDDILTVSEAARFLGKNPGTVRRYIISGLLRGKRISAGGSGVYVLLKSDVLEWIVIRSASRKVKLATKKPSRQIEMKL
jgi:hypothetical protein